MQNEIYLRFCVWGYEDISHGDISNYTGLTPTIVYKKGEKKNKNYSALAKENGWIFQPVNDKYSCFEDQINILLELIRNKKNVFQSLCAKYKCEISCAIYIYYDNNESLPSINLNSEYHRIMGEMNIEFDLDIYCLPNSDETQNAIKTNEG